MKESVTIAEIARGAGVSPATVSRVLNGTAPVAEATRKKVLAAVRGSHYAPSQFARGLAGARSMTLGVMTPDITNPYFSTLLLEIEQAARQAGYSIFLYNSSFTASQVEERTRQELVGFQHMREKRVDGVVVAGGQADLLRVREEYRDGLARLAEQVPTVVLGGPEPCADCLWIQRDTGRCVELALEYLVSLGHRKIAFVGGEPGVGVTEVRLRAYREFLGRVGLPADPSRVALSDYYAPDGYRAMTELLRDGAEFTAFLAMNDHVALGAMRALADAGLRVPEDLSAVSCDQFITAEYFLPRLTAVDRHDHRLGQILVDALLELIRGGRPQKPEPIQPELVVRESCRSLS